MNFPPQIKCWWNSPIYQRTNWVLVSLEMINGRENLSDRKSVIYQIFMAFFQKFEDFILMVSSFQKFRDGQQWRPRSLNIKESIDMVFGRWERVEMKAYYVGAGHSGLKLIKWFLVENSSCLIKGRSSRWWAVILYLTACSKGERGAGVHTLTKIRPLTVVLELEPELMRYLSGRV